MQKKRERLDIICDMLASIREKGGEIKPTHLMYKANLAHRQLQSYLDELVEKNLVVRTQKRDFEYLRITDDGLKFLSKLKEMREFEQTFGF